MFNYILKYININVYFNNPMDIKHVDVYHASML